MMQQIQPVPMHDAELDDQHRHLLALLARLRRAAAEGHSRRTLRPLLDELLDHTVSHFYAEEALMKRSGFPGRAAHNHLHGAMVDHLVRIINEFDRGMIIVSERMIDNLADWIAIHLDTQDRAFGAYLESIGHRGQRASVRRESGHGPVEQPCPA